MGYATKRVKRKRHNHNRAIIVAAALGGARVVRWEEGEYYSLLLPCAAGAWSHEVAEPGHNPLTLWKHAAKQLGVRF